MEEKKQTILTITGSDGTGQSGVQADTKTIAALGGCAVSVITSITVQNTLGIQLFHDLPAAVVAQQIDAVVNDVQPKIVKIGLIRSVDVLHVIVEALRQYKPKYVVYVPTFVASNGERLTGPDVVRLIESELLPLCHVVVSHRSRTHGENNAYASAIAFYLAEGLDLSGAQTKAKDYVLRLQAKAGGLYGRANSLYRSFLTLLEQHGSHSYDVGFYAEQLNVSPRYLSQVCSKTAAMPPKQIIEEHLAKRIETLLGTTTRSIKEIATATGFSSQAHLSKFFKRLRGTTPTQYRNS